MQRLKRSDAEVKDGAEVEVASTGWQLLYLYGNAYPWYPT